MNSIAGVKSANAENKEKEQYWQEHARLQKESGLSRIGYCRKHKLNYDHLSYWEQKWRRQQTVSTRLLPVVQVTKPAKATTNPQIETICTLVFKNDHELRIHDKAVVSLLLSLWS